MTEFLSERNRESHSEASLADGCALLPEAPAEAASVRVRTIG
jgi:hypothetical protein